MELAHIPNQSAQTGSEAEAPREFGLDVLESISDGLFTLDAGWRLTYINAMAEQLLGGRREEMLGKINWQLYPELLGTIAEREFRRAARDRETVEFEHWYEPWQRWFAVKAYPLSQGGISVCFRDITAGKEAELRIAKSEQRLRAIYDGTYEYICLLSPDGKLIEANRASLAFGGNALAEVLGLPFWETPWFANTPDAPRAVKQAVGRAAAGESVRFDLTLLRPSGESWEFDISFHPVLDAKGEVELIVQESRNITEQKKDKERLRQQWRMFDTVLSNVTDLLYILDKEARFTYVNRAVISKSQRSLENTIGKNGLEVGYPAPLAERLLRQVQQVIETGAPVRDETPLRAPDGEMRYYEYVYSPVLAADGSVEAVAGSTRDVTERKRAEEHELQRQAQMLNIARLESLGVMAGGVAHDFNNLLTGILGNASLLAESSAENSVSIANEIVLAAERAAELTRQMLAYSGQGRFLIEPFDLNQLIQENLMLMRASLSRAVNIELELGCASCLVEGDRIQIHQVIMNLLINASEASEDHPGKVKIRSTTIERQHEKRSNYLHTLVPPGNYAMLEVRDEGSGMSGETLKRIFDPFFTTKFTGRGLGLAAVLGIVKGHRGDIEVESRVGAGTTFRIFLPVSHRAVRSDRTAPPTPHLRVAHQTVLVVDDEATVRKVAKLALERAGFRVVTADDGVEALEILSAVKEISLIVLDLTMPVMTGEQALPLIREMRPNIPVLLSSGFNEAEIIRRFSDAGIAGVLQKPYRSSSIVSKVTESLFEANQRRAIHETGS